MKKLMAVEKFIPAGIGESAAFSILRKGNIFFLGRSFFFVDESQCTGKIHNIVKIFFQIFFAAHQKNPEQFSWLSGDFSLPLWKETLRGDAGPF